MPVSSLSVMLLVSRLIVCKIMHTAGRFYEFQLLRHCSLYGLWDFRVVNTFSKTGVLIIYNAFWQIRNLMLLLMPSVSTMSERIRCTEIKKVTQKVLLLIILRLSDPRPHIHSCYS